MQVFLQDLARETRMEEDVERQQGKRGSRWRRHRLPARRGGPHRIQPIRRERKSGRRPAGSGREPSRGGPFPY